MNKLLGFWKEHEQVLSFLFIIVYLNSFFFIFESEMRNDWKYSVGWLIQFFGLCTHYGLRANKKGWKLPKKY